MYTILNTGGLIILGMVSKERLDGYRLPVIQETPHRVNFLDAIDKSNLKEVLTPQSPWVDFTMEVYAQEHGLIGGGGLGILKGDTAIEAQKLGFPLVIFSLFYPKRMTQVINGDFYQLDIPTDPVSPADIGYEWMLDTQARANGDEIRLDVYKVIDLPVYVLYEPGLEYQYPGENNIDHRLYQDAMLAFGGVKAYRVLGLTPPVIQIDEAPAALVPLAEMDYLCQQGLSLDEAKSEVRSKTIFTNHTLVNAVEAVFTAEQFEKYVVKNLETEEVIAWLRGLINDHNGRLALSRLAIELSGVRNGVSKIHAVHASKMYQERDGSLVTFHPVTNGISRRWIEPEFYRVYESAGMVNQDFLPTSDYQERIETLDPVTLRALKDLQRAKLRDYLLTRRDQYDRVVMIDDEAIAACWNKRIAGYKRPEMLFTYPQVLSEILHEKNIHVILSGKAHPTDTMMKERLQWVLKTIDANNILRQRVHFIQNYDAELAKRLVFGVDVGFNTPRIRDEFGNRINTEADGTFWKKLIANLAILISTRDGGVADLDNLPCFEIVGETDEEELASLYSCLEGAADARRDLAKWEPRVKDQLKGYLPIISGPRMIANYITLMGKPPERPIIESSKLVVAA